MSFSLKTLRDNSPILSSCDSVPSCPLFLSTGDFAISAGQLRGIFQRLVVKSSEILSFKVLVLLVNSDSSWTYLGTLW